MKKLLSSIMCIPLFIQAQENSGIKWIEDLSWQQIQKKAKEENKYIFVDCYASWCGPCKQMDKDVFPKDSVGDYVNAHFISVKLQMDTSQRDDESVKSRYSDAHYLAQQYMVLAFPTYLFFSPDSKIVHKEIGAKNVIDFVELATNVSNPDRQYYTLLEKYKHGNNDYAMMPYLANTAQKFNENDLAFRIASYYMHNYLNKLTDSEFCTKTNLDFIGCFYEMISSKDRAFNFYYYHADDIDAIMKDRGYSSKYINYIIYKEEITPKLTTAINRGQDPDWKGITKGIKKKYNTDYAESNVLSAKIGWYRQKKEWKNYVKYMVQKIEKDGVGNIQPSFMICFFLNNYAFEVFKYSNNKKELTIALSWSERAILLNSEPNAQQIDTKANILYKLGRKKESIVLEEKAAKLDDKDKDIKDNLIKMKKGLRTWPCE